jgi:hypothetical protein
MKTPKISESEVAKDFLTMFNKGLDIWASIDLRENKNEPPPAREIYDLCLCFAARMMFHEIEERGYTYEQCLATEDGARQCVIRFYEWMLARARGFRLLLLKENPEGEHPDKEINDAIFAAHLAKRGELQHPFFNQFDLEKLSKAAKNNFDRVLSKPTQARWNYPQLDMWLVSIWPLVTAYNWTYRDVWMIAARHPQLEELLRLETVASFARHCKFLELRLSPKGSQKTGRVKGDAESSLPYMANLALQCRADLPENSLFCQ